MEEGVSHGAQPRCAIRQAETGVRAGTVGLLVEWGWAWSIFDPLSGSRSRVCRWEWAHQLHSRTGEGEFLGLVPAWR